MNFGELIKEEREKKGLSINGVANLMEISPSYLLRMERGENLNPTINVVIRACEVLEIDYRQMIACITRGVRDTNGNEYAGVMNSISKIERKNYIEIRDIINLLEEVDKTINKNLDEYLIIYAKEKGFVVKLVDKKMEKLLREAFAEIENSIIIKVKGIVEHKLSELSDVIFYLNIWTDCEWGLRKYID